MVGGRDASATPSAAIGDATYERAEEVLLALSYPTRLKLLVRLLEGQQSVGDLAQVLDAEISLVSKQLRVLRGARLIATTREGRQVYCRIADDETKRFVRLVLSYAASRLERTARRR